MNRYFFYNTNLPSNLRNVDFLLNGRCAVTSGGRKYGEQFGTLHKGDTLLMYENGTGVVGIGTVAEVWDGIQHEASTYYPNPVPNLDEYRITVDWDRDVSLELLHTPIAIAELRERFDSPKFTPRGSKSAVLTIEKHQAAAGRLVEELRSRHRSAPSVGKDIEETSNRSDLDATTKAVLIEARIGQGRFRDDVLRLWNNRCAVTGSTTREAIRASHINPWRESNDNERLDPHNGIPLIATLDALFDRGLISFDATGKMLVSDKLYDDERKVLGISEERRIEMKSGTMAKYLQWHLRKFEE